MSSRRAEIDAEVARRIARLEAAVVELIQHPRIDALLRSGGHLLVPASDPCPNLEQLLEDHR